MAELPTHQCASCGYPIFDPAASQTCPECGAGVSKILPLNAMPLTRCGILSLWASTFAHIVLGICTLVAITQSTQSIRGLQVAIQTTYFGWWIAFFPASAAIILGCLGTRTRPPQQYPLCLGISLAAWLLTAIGLFLHGGSREAVEVGLALSALAPIAIFGLYLVPLIAIKQLFLRAYSLCAVANGIVAATGMAGYVGIATLYYFDHAVGLDLYLGSNNAAWFDRLFTGGLIVFLLGTSVTLVVTMKLQLEHQSR